MNLTRTATCVLLLLAAGSAHAWTAEELAAKVISNYERALPTTSLPKTLEELLRVKRARAIAADHLGQDAVDRALAVILGHELMEDICERISALESRKR